MSTGQGMTALPAFIQAVGVALAAIGGVAAWWFKERLERRGEKHRRDEKVLDYVRAIRVDLMVDIEPLEKQFKEPGRTQLRDRLLRRAHTLPEDPAGKVAGEGAHAKAAPPSEKDMPQAPVAPRSFVFDFVKKDIAILPRNIIEPVVAYYKRDQHPSGVMEAFSKGQYEGLSDERQFEAIDHYFSLGDRTLEAALEALAACNEHLGDANKMQTRSHSAEEKRNASSKSNRRNDGSNDHDASSTFLIYI